MENWITYIVECALCLALLYLPFWGLLKKETFFQYNRFVLLAITVLSFILPWISIPEITSQLAPSETISIQLEEINVMISGKALSENISWKTILAIIYLSGAVTCLLYKMIDLVRLVRFIPRGCLWVHTENGNHIHCHAHDVVPFSWMNHIVISEKDYEENGHNILLHEQAHIACGHSWDVLWLSFVEVLQWFNPFVWMLSKEIQDIHEYEADLTVLRKGINARDYQLLIIQKVVGSGSYTFANNFNHSSLKKRITMMIKEKSNPWARLKYLYILPILAICMIACTQSAKSTMSYEEVEVKPEYPGGMGELSKFLSSNLRYPLISFENGVQGEVLVQFVVDKEGNVEEVTVFKGVDPYLDAEALRVIKMMPKWKPGKHEGKEVNVKCTIPVGFRLQ
jgi:TonB family protein